MRWTIATVAVAVVVFGGLYALRSPLHCEGCSGCTNLAPESEPFLGPESPLFEQDSVQLDVVCAPSRGARPWDYWNTARKTCQSWGVLHLARQFRTKPAPDAVGSAYARWMRSNGLNARTADESKLQAVHAGCLQGLSERL